MTSNWLSYCKSFIPKIKERHKQMLGRECDLENPQRFTDKLEWLKVYDSSFLKTYCADKLTVRKYVTQKLGHDITFPVLGVYDKFDDIDFSTLPNDYVIKTNHGSHTNMIVRNRNINVRQASDLFNTWLSKDWSWWGYELLYIPISRKIFIEPLMSDGHTDLVDYKFLCFNGIPRYCQVISDRNNTLKRLNYYDLTWTPMYNISRTDFKANYNILDRKPATFNQMIDYATTLSADFKFVRVDFYEINEHVYFGELTFIPAAAYITYTNDYVDYEFGNYLLIN
jgi:hypothetical protein